MSKWKKTSEKCRRGDKNIRWDDVMVLLRRFGIYDTNPKKTGSHRVYSHPLIDKHDQGNFLVIRRPHGKRENYIHFKDARKIADYIEMIQYYEEMED